MKAPGKLRGFTLTELIVGMLLFSMVMAASCTALIASMNLFYKETSQTASSIYADSALDFIARKLRYGINVEITDSYTSSEKYEKYFDGDGDVVLYVSSAYTGSDTRKIYLMEKVSGSYANKKVLYEMSEADMVLKCTPNVMNQTAEFELTVTEKGANGKKLFDRTKTVRRLNAENGSFTASFSGSREADYYIFIDID